MNNTETCATCKYGDVTETNLPGVFAGDCRRYPPIWVGGNLTKTYKKYDGMNQPMFDVPGVFGDGWCGEWKAK